MIESEANNRGNIYGTLVWVYENNKKVRERKKMCFKWARLHELFLYKEVSGHAGWRSWWRHRVPWGGNRRSLLFFFFFFYLVIKECTTRGGCVRARCSEQHLQYSRLLDRGIARLHRRAMQIAVASSRPHNDCFVIFLFMVYYFR